jgi:hypothetical protein
VHLRLVILTLAALSLQAAPILNWSFENPDISGDATFYRVIPAGDAGLLDWSVTGVSVDIVHNRAGAGWAQDGNQAVDLAGTPGPGGINQDIATVAGQTYQLVFWASSNGGALANLDVNFGGSTLATGLATPPFGTWTQYTYFVTATSAISNLEFATGLGGNAGPLLDNISLSEVPEPASLAGVLAGLAAIAAVRLRRRR